MEGKTMKQLGLIVAMAIAMLAVCPAVGKPKNLDPRIKDVRKVFVKGTNEAAERAREELTKNGCLSLAGSAESADAVMEVNADAVSQGGLLGNAGARNWIVSSTLTLKSGDLIWSKSTRMMDAPFKGGGGVAGKLLVNYLSKDTGCK